ncbi:hypothetical protein KC318_g4060 [Hortaea werneckii]|nr:hypothetical protein KC334_g3712 [Hortaea werneckii]KAI7014420.1 hypothetical protein KC355_g4699 [Hortaea werneckii]KAI7188316.1 hypothetical protein KC324_g6649 [Hortaea werneckii]KAI7585205.1 hypothetical protein KC316_g6294 [Hortaea werneckii]KAI7670410.1 hypothetical protein KC318_g4060 [Hortaea werneckii]
MSVNINFTLPLDVVAAMQDLPDEPSGGEAKAAITPAAAQAVAAGVKTLPFSVAAKSAAAEQKRKRDEDRISIWVKGEYRDVARISINPAAAVYDLKNTIRTQYGIPYEEQGLLFNENFLDDTKTLQEYNVGTGSQIHLAILFGEYKLTPTSNYSRT